MRNSSTRSLPEPVLWVRPVVQSLTRLTPARAGSRTAATTACRLGPEWVALAVSGVVDVGVGVGVDVAVAVGVAVAVAVGVAVGVAVAVGVGVGVAVGVGVGVGEAVGVGVAVGPTPPSGKIRQMLATTGPPWSKPSCP